MTILRRVKTSRKRDAALQNSVPSRHAEILKDLQTSCELTAGGLLPKYLRKKISAQPQMLEKSCSLIFQAKPGILIRRGILA